MLRFLARFLAVVLAALFVLATVAAVFVRPVGSRLLDPQTYKRVLLEKQFAERFPAMVAEGVAKAVALRARNSAEEGTEDTVGVLASLSQEDLEGLIAAVLPPDYVRAQSGIAIDQFLSYVNSAAARPVLLLSLVDLKQRLTGGVLEDAYVRMLQTKPPCSTATDALPVSCCPPAEELPVVRARFRDLVAPAVRELPDSVDLFAEQANTYSIYPVLAKVRNRLQLLATLARWCWVLPVVLLAGVAGFGVRTLRGGLLWLGLPCLVAGGFVLVCVVPAAAMGNWFFEYAVRPALPPDVPVLAVTTVVGLLTGIVQVVLGAALKSSLWLVGAGAAAVVLATVLRKRKSPPAVQSGPSAPPPQG